MVIGLKSSLGRAINTIPTIDPFSTFYRVWEILIFVLTFTLFGKIPFDYSFGDE